MNNKSKMSKIFMSYSFYLLNLESNKTYYNILLNQIINILKTALDNIILS